METYERTQALREICSHDPQRLADDDHFDAGCDG